MKTQNMIADNRSNEPELFLLLIKEHDSTNQHDAKS